MTCMPLQPYTAKLAEKKLLNSKYCLFDFEVTQPHLIEFKAGQYIILAVPRSDALRQYSIASEPENNHSFQLLVNLGPGGEGSQYLSQLKYGDTIEFRGPAGIFTLAPKQSEDRLVFVATGAGIAPIRSMVIDLLVSQQDKRPLKLYWGMRFIDDMFWQEDFYQMTQDHDNFEFDLVISRPTEAWPLAKGYVTDLLKTSESVFSDTGYYICGGGKMVNDVKTLLLENGVEEEMIHHERFY